MALRNARRFDEAISAYQEAAAIYCEVGDRHGEGVALKNLESIQAAAKGLCAPQDERATIVTRTYDSAAEASRRALLPFSNDCSLWVTARLSSTRYALSNYADPTA